MAQSPGNLSYQLAKASTALTFLGSLLFLSGLTLTAAVIGLIVGTPLLVIFSPVLVPAALAMLLLGASFITSGGLGATAGLVFYWAYNYVTGQNPVGADKLEQVANMFDQLVNKLASGFRNIKDRAEQSRQKNQK